VSQETFDSCSLRGKEKPGLLHRSCMQIHVNFLPAKNFFRNEIQKVTGVCHKKTVTKSGGRQLMAEPDHKKEAPVVMNK
jgi:hypothetical protein